MPERVEYWKSKDGNAYQTEWEATIADVVYETRKYSIALLVGVVKKRQEEEEERRKEEAARPRDDSAGSSASVRSSHP